MISEPSPARFAQPYLLSTVVGATTAASVLVLKRAVSALDLGLHRPFPAASPVIGSLIVSACYCADMNVGKSALVSNADGKLRFAVSPSHLLWRALALVASVGCGCSIGKMLH